MHIQCPHCHGPIEIVDAGTREVLCPSCGSSFFLERGVTTAVISPDEPRKLGKFQLLAPVGIGAFGTVFKARDPELDRIVAVKVPRTGNLSSAGERDRFLREARSVAQLRHPGIVPVHEVGQADDLPYLVSEFVHGVTLADLLTAQRPPPAEAARLVAAVADALQYAHEHGVIHRDVKPSNIMLEVVSGGVVSGEWSGAGRGSPSGAGRGSPDPAHSPLTTHHSPLTKTHGLRPGQARRRRDHHDDGRPGAGHAGLHESGAGPR